jgi:hypothetical protein
MGKYKVVSALVLIVGSFLSGCVSPPPRADVSQAMPAGKSDLVGTWVAYEQTPDDPWRFPQAYGLTIYPDNSGEYVVSAIFQSMRGRAYSIAKNELRIEPSPTGGWQVDFLDDGQQLEGDSSHGWGYSRPTDVPLILTPQGLVLDMDWNNHVYYIRTNSRPESTYAHISDYVEKQRKIIMGATYPGKSPAGHSPGADAMPKHVLASTLQMGAGVAAMSDGNHAAAQQAFDAVQRQTMAGMQGQDFDARQAGEDAFYTGAAIATDGASVEATRQSGALSGPAPAASHAVKQVAEVDVDSRMITAYSDGYAYDVLTLLPQPGSGGEYTFLYGQTKDNAKSLLETGYQLAGSNSTYGTGNPRQQISYRKYPIREGQKIKYGIDVRAGQFVNKPAGYISYGVMPLR